MAQDYECGCYEGATQVMRLTLQTDGTAYDLTDGTAWLNIPALGVDEELLTIDNGTAGMVSVLLAGTTTTPDGDYSYYVRVAKGTEECFWPYPELGVLHIKPLPTAPVGGT